MYSCQTLRLSHTKCLQPRPFRSEFGQLRFLRPLDWQALLDFKDLQACRHVAEGSGSPQHMPCSWLTMLSATDSGTTAPAVRAQRQAPWFWFGQRCWRSIHLSENMLHPAYLNAVTSTSQSERKDSYNPSILHPRSPRPAPLVTLPRRPRPYF